MKLLIVTGAALSVFAVTSVTPAAPAVTPISTTVATTAPAVSPVPIDGIDVPFEVLMYAQTEYQGHAVTQAERATRDGKQVYRLRVDRDNIPDDYESIYLLYDMEWKLIGEEKMQPPRRPAVPYVPDPEIEDLEDEVERQVQNLESQIEAEVQNSLREAARQVEESMQRQRPQNNNQQDKPAAPASQSPNSSPESTASDTPRSNVEAPANDD